MKPMPGSLTQMMDEALHLGLLNNKFNSHDGEIPPRVKLLRSAHNSHLANRSFNAAYMMLMGPSGAGKSATVNHLLGVDTASTSSEMSSTRSTTEYLVTAEDPSLDVTDLSLGIIDTPGSNDTYGEQQDACNLTSMKDFLKGHTLLGSNSWMVLNSPKYFPNIVLIVINASDERILGENSAVLKVLRTIRHLKITDKKNPNVVVALSHACSLPRRSWKTLLEQKSSMVKTAVRETLEIDVPVVYIENEYEEYELEMSPTKETSYLYDRTMQPANLFLAITGLLISNNDELGLMAFKRFFSLSMSMKSPATVRCVQAKIAATEKLGKAEYDMLKILRNEITFRAQSEIKNVITDYLTQNELSKECLSEAGRICNLLIHNLDLETTEDVKEYSIANLNYLISGPPLTGFGIKMLCDIFGLQNVASVPFPYMIVGSGYHILNDEVLPMALFRQDEDVFIESPYGFHVSKGMTLSKIDQTEVITRHFDNKGEQVKQRLSQLGVNAAVDVSKFNLKYGVAVGANYRRRADNEQVSTSLNAEYSYLYEKRVFKIEIKNLSELTVTDDFQAAVRRLPSEFMKDNESNINVFQDFFNGWGHYVILSAYGGGSVEVTQQVKEESEERSAVGGQAVAASLEVFFRSVKSDANHDEMKSDFAKEFSHFVNANLKWNGGESAHHTRTLHTMTSNTFTKWEQSLLTNPASLYTKLALKPIYELFDKMGVAEAKVAACRDAHYNLLGEKRNLSKQEDKKPRSEKPVAQTTQPPCPPDNGQLVSTTLSERKTLSDTQNMPSGKSCFPGNSLVRVSKVAACRDAHYNLLGEKRNLSKQEDKKPRSEKPVAQTTQPPCPPDNGQLVSTTLSECKTLSDTQNMPSGKSCFPGNSLVRVSKVAACRDAHYNLLGEKRNLSKQEDKKPRSEKPVAQTTQPPCPPDNGQLVSTTLSERKTLSDTQNMPSGKSCFPGNSLVRVRHEDKPKLMRDLRIGDEVLSSVMGKMSFSPVYMFAHVDPLATTSFLEIYTCDGLCISISPKHLLQVNRNGNYKFADKVKIGDMVFVATKVPDGFEFTEKKVETIILSTKIGFFAPFTMSGTIVVDDVLASCYANVSGFGSIISAQSLCHAGVAILRWAYNCGFGESLLRIADGKHMSKIIEVAVVQLSPFLTL